MVRRAAGVLLLVAVLVAGAIVARLTGPDSAGRPTAAPLPQPPAVGSCLTMSAKGWVDVPCSLSHRAEVTTAWRAWDPSIVGVEPNQVRRWCHAAGREYLGAVENSDTLGRGLALPQLGLDWSAVPLRFTTDVVDGPNRHDGPLGYRACVVVPQAPTSALTPVGPLTADVMSLLPMAVRPAPLRTCYAARSLMNQASSLSCSTWHRGEVLAAAVVPIGRDLRSELVDPGRQRSCSGLAAGLIGAKDPTFGGRLRITTDGTEVSLGLTERNGQLVSARSAMIHCVVEAAPGRLLTGSVIGLGAGVLPVR